MVEMEVELDMVMVTVTSEGRRVDEEVTERERMKREMGWVRRKVKGLKKGLLVRLGVRREQREGKEKVVKE